MAMYEDGIVAKVGDSGTFANSDEGGGYLYEGIVVKIDEQQRLVIRENDDTSVTIKAKLVKFTSN